MRKSALASVLGLLAVGFVAVGARGGDGGGAVQVTKGPYLQELGPTGVAVRMELSAAAVAAVVATPVDSKEPPVTVRDEARAFHTIRLDGFTPLTRYRYLATAPGAQVGGTFTTAPGPDSVAGFSFLIYGDDRSDDVSHAAVVRALRDAPSDFLVHTGDFVEDGSHPSEWQTFFDIEEPLLRERCVFACVGNHELLEAQGTSFLRYFGPSPSASEDAGDSPPKLYGSVRWGDTRFFMLNGMDAWTTSSEKEWLEDELRKADHEPGLAWRFVVVHFGPWSSGPHGPNRKLLDAGIPAMLRAHGVDLVLSGHDHIFERGEDNGIRYIVSGGGGAPLYRNVSPLPSTIKVEPTYHFIEATVTDRTVSLVAKRLDGSILDRACFGHTPGWDCSPKPAVAERLAPTAAAEESRAPSVAASKCGCREAGSAAPRGGAILLLLALLGLLGARRASRERGLI
jgi:hypothetical protein